MVIETILARSIQLIAMADHGWHGQDPSHELRAPEQPPGADLTKQTSSHLQDVGKSGTSIEIS